MFFNKLNYVEEKKKLSLLLQEEWMEREGNGRGGWKNGMQNNKKNVWKDCGMFINNGN